MEIKFFVFSKVAFQYSEVYEKEAKHDKHNYKRGLSVEFDIKNV